MESDEKCFDSISLSISNETTKLEEFENEFKKYLGDKNSPNNPSNTVTTSLKQIQTAIKNHKTIISAITQNNKQVKQHNNTSVCVSLGIDPIVITDIDAIDDSITKMINQISETISNFVTIDRKLQEKMTPQCTIEQTRNRKCNNIDWKLGYFYDFSDRGKTQGIHGIYDNGKTFICQHDGKYGLACNCFARISFGMKPNTGVYKIRINIDTICSDYKRNMIGITCNTHKTNNSKYYDI